MTDLIALSDIVGELTLLAETKVNLDAACSALQHMRDTYEDDRTASAQVAADLRWQIDAQALLLKTEDATITDLQSNVSALNGTITSLQTQVVSLTQRNASLDADNDTLTGLNDALTSNLASCNQLVITQRAQIASLSPDVTVTIGGQITTSNFSTAVSHVATGDLLLGDATARARAESALAPAFAYHRVSAHSFGAGDPWLWNGTGTRPVDPTNWGNLDGLVQMSQRMSANTIMGFGNWPWHTRGRWDGANTVPCTYADQLVTDGRPITEKMPDVLHFVECVCKRYMVAPYNIKMWQLGSWEFHGMDRGRDGTYNHWAFDAYAGSPGQANMGMAYLHNQVAAKIVSTAASLGISRSALTIITNYPPTPTYGAINAYALPVGNPLRGQPWGNVDKRSPEMLEGMLPLLDPTLWDVWSFDTGIWTKDGIIPPGATDWAAQAKFTDITRYFMSRVAALGYGNKPCWISEVYPKPLFDPGANSQAYRAAIAAEAMRRMVLEGVSLGIIWSTVGRANDPGVTTDAALHTAVTTSTGGQPQAMLGAVKLFHDYFPPGTPIYDATITGSGVSAIAGGKGTILINQTATPRKVAVGGDVYTLAGYEVRGVRS